jgi:hypothetical protein
VIGTIYTSFFGLYLAHTKGFAEAPHAKLVPEAGGIGAFQVSGGGTSKVPLFNVFAMIRWYRLDAIILLQDAAWTMCRTWLWLL